MRKLILGLALAGALFAQAPTPGPIVGGVGGSGGGGSTTGNYTCSVSAATSVTCTHNLGTTTPQVWCYDADGYLLGSDDASPSVSSVNVQATSANVAVLDFSGAFTGTCKIATGGGDKGDQGIQGESGVGSTRSACWAFGADNAASDLVDADLGPQGDIVLIPVAATIIEVSVKANAGTPSLPILQRVRSGSATDLTSGALATGASGALACAATGSACLDGTSKSGSISIVTTGSANVLAAGDWIQTKTGSGFASSGAKRLSVCVTYTLN